MIIYLSRTAPHTALMRTKAAGIPPDKTSPTTRERIVLAAQRLFAERGYFNVSMPTIARASGITAGAIYRHFEGKEDLFFEAVARRAIAAAEMSDAGSGDPAIDLPQVVAGYTSARLKLLRQLAVEVHAASVHNAKVRRLLNQALSGNFEQLRTRIVAGRALGTLDSSTNADLLARAVMVFVMGLMHMETLLPDLIDDPTWHDFVEARIGGLLGASSVHE